ncbi:anhydro-N-acetylmuramic acid kinase, partial [Acidithiobacillus ferridurans]|nr:anhydro-N-acetylmuramic acid kinase [Acidithiobacillus ferridurans]
LERFTGARQPMILGNILPGDNWPDLLVQLSQRPEITAREGPYHALRSV